MAGTLPAIRGGVVPPTGGPPWRITTTAALPQPMEGPSVMGHVVVATPTEDLGVVPADKARAIAQAAADEGRTTVTIRDAVTDKVIETVKPQKPTAITLDIETLSAISSRLYVRAGEIQQVTLAELAADMRIAARACELLAHLRFELGELATKTKDSDTRLELRGLLDDCAVAQPTVGQP